MNEAAADTLTPHRYDYIVNRGRFDCFDYGTKYLHSFDQTKKRVCSQSAISPESVALRSTVPGIIIPVRLSGAL